MADSRRGWSGGETNDGWWFQEKDTSFKVKFTKEGEDQLFGGATDESDLQLPDAVQFCSHVFYEFKAPPILVPSRSNCKEFTGILDNANDPAPSLEVLSWMAFLIPAAHILDAIKSRKLSILTSLTIWDVEFEVEVLAIAIESGCLPFLKTLTLGYCSGHRGLAEVMQAGHMPLLEELRLVSNEITIIECKAYANAFTSGKLPSLTIIDFSENKIGNKGVQALALALRELKNLADLNLRWCGFGDDGMIAIADSFVAAHGSCVSNLRTLDFSHNRYTDVGLCKLADALKNGQLNSLQELDVRGLWKASSAGAGALVSALAFNVHLNVEVQFEWEKFPDLKRRKDYVMQRSCITLARMFLQNVLAFLES